MISKEAFLLRPPRPDQGALDAVSEIRRTAYLLLRTGPSPTPSSEGFFSPNRKVTHYQPPIEAKRKVNYKCTISARKEHVRHFRHVMA